jgi:hypothetical protein
MIDWQFAEALAVDTRQAVTRWWARRRPLAAAPIPDGLADDLQAARLALEEDLQRRLWDLATILPAPQRADLTKRIAELDPWHVLSEMAAGRAQPDPAAGEREAASEDDRDLIAALKERARAGASVWNDPNFQTRRGVVCAILREVVAVSRRC